MIHSDLTVSNIDHFDDFSVHDLYNGYCWYHFTTHTADSAELGVQMCFHNHKLHSVKLALTDKTKYGSSWSDWSESKEKQCAVDTESWLNTLGSTPGTYGWGSIWAGYDPKAATGYALINCL